MSELTDLLAEQTAPHQSLVNQKDWHTGVNKTYFTGATKSSSTPAEWTGAGRDAFLTWHDTQGVNADDLDQMFVDMVAERASTENSSPANAIAMNSEISAVITASIDSYVTDIAAIQARIDAGETTIAP